MPYVKKETRPGRPKVHAPGAEPRSIGLRLPRQLYVRLETAAKAQRTSLSALVVRALSQHLTGIAQLAVIDDGLTAAMEAMAELDHSAIDTAWPVMERALAALDHLTGKASQPKETAS